MASLLDLLELVRLKVRIYHTARVCGNWQITEHEVGSTCFHMPIQGRCLMRVPDHGEWRLNAGDVVIFPRELPHTLYPENALTGPQEHLPIASSQEIEGTSLLCGEIAFQHRGSSNLLGTLPPVLVISASDAKPWLAPLVDLIVAESLRPDCDSQSPLLNRLCELLVSYTIRCFAENSPLSHGILKLYSDSRLTAAIDAIHAQPAHTWTLAELAQTSAMSRTQFANYFKEVCGWTPMQYLTWWRLQLAYAYLQQGWLIIDAAEAVGYGSEAAFSRAFKHLFNETPGQVRNKHR